MPQEQREFSLLGMSSEQVLVLVRQALPALGGIAITFGWLTKDQVSELTASMLGLSGPSMIFGSALWGLYVRRKAGILASAAAIPEVKAITLDPTAPETLALNGSTPDKVKIEETTKGQGVNK